MRELAQFFDKPEQEWVLVGLLHDLDYDTVDDFSQHGLEASKLLCNQLSREMLHAIQAHDYRTGVIPESLLDEALVFADSLTVFIDSKGDLDENNSIFVAKPWLWENLTLFPDKYDLDVGDLIAQLVI